MTRKPGKGMHALLAHADTDYPALRAAGMTPEEEQALDDDPRLATVALEAIRRDIQRTIEIDEAVRRREALAKNIGEHNLLERRVVNLLRLRGIVVLGDLASRTRFDLGKYRDIGVNTLEDIDRILEDHHLPQLDAREHLPEHLIFLYGGGQYIPTNHLHEWMPGLSAETKDYLVQFETLGRLAENSRQEFVLGHPRKSWVLKQDCSMIATALERVGLRFRGE